MTTINANTRQAAFGQVDPFHDLLPTLARGLDVRDIFQQLSIVASRVVVLPASGDTRSNDRQPFQAAFGS